MFKIEDALKEEEFAAQYLFIPIVNSDWGFLKTSFMKVLKIHGREKSADILLKAINNVIESKPDLKNFVKFMNEIGIELVIL